eukprot:6492328-Amphidinium_carterae.5
MPQCAYLDHVQMPRLILDHSSDPRQDQFKISMIRALYPLVIYGSEVSGLAATPMHKVRVSARSALGRGAQLRRATELELALKGGVKADPQVTLGIFIPSGRGSKLCSEGKRGLLHRSSGNLHLRVAEEEDQLGTSTLFVNASNGNPRPM